MRGYIGWILQYRWLVIGLTVVITALAISQARNLRIVIDPNTMLPQTHPYVATTNEVEKVFGSKYVIVIGITPKSGDIYQPDVLGRVQRITSALMQTPGVVKENLLSLSARRAKDIMGTPDGMQVSPLMREVPQTPQQYAQLKAALHRNPAYMNSIVSQDEKTAAILVEFRDTPNAGFRKMMDAVNRVVDKERGEAVEFSISGMPSYLSRVESYSERMGFLLPIAILLVGLILFEAFRTFQGMFLPLVTAILAVAWGIGTMGAVGIPMDAFNATTPILILAVSAGHAVQLLKRYYEEYYRILDRGTTPAEANRLAVIESIARSGPVMIVAGIVAALGFFSLVVFEITTVRTFGIFTGIGIVAALILEMTFIPALRSLLRPPGAKDRKVEQRVRVWDRIESGIASIVSNHRRRVFVGAAAFALFGLAGMSMVVTNNSTKTYFTQDLPFQAEDRFLNSHLGGTNTLALLIEGKDQDAIKDPRVLQAMDDIQRFLEQQTYEGRQVAGKTVSMVDFIRRMNQSMHGDDPAYDRIPDDRNLIAQYLLLYSMSGEPGDFDSYVDSDYRLANMTAYLKTDSSAYIESLIAKLEPFAREKLAGTGATLHIGGSVPQGAALNQTMVHGKILNIAQIGAVVFIISSLVFRSLLAGLMVLLPLLMAVIANFGLMGYTGMYLNISNSLSSAMAVGIGADYAIYLIFRLREEIANGLSETEAVRLVLATAGKACLFVAVAISVGYGVLMFSIGFNIHFWLASLIATAMMVSVFSALFLIPSLVLTFRPKFVYKGVNK